MWVPTENRITQRQTWFNATLFNTNSTWGNLGSNTGLHSEKPAFGPCRELRDRELKLLLPVWRSVSDTFQMNFRCDEMALTAALVHTEKHLNIQLSPQPPIKYLNSMSWSNTSVAFIWDSVWKGVISDHTWHRLYYDCTWKYLFIISTCTFWVSEYTPTYLLNFHTWRRFLLRLYSEVRSYVPHTTSVIVRDSLVSSHVHTWCWF